MTRCNFISTSLPIFVCCVSSPLSLPFCLLANFLRGCNMSGKKIANRKDRLLLTQRITTHSVSLSHTHTQKQTIFIYMSTYSLFSCTHVGDMPFPSPEAWWTISHQDKSCHALSSCLLPELKATS